MRVDVRIRPSSTPADQTLNLPRPILFSLALTVTLWSSVVGARPAPTFTLPGIDAPVTLTTLRGKVVYVDFWASWCAPCRRSFPWMDALQQRHADQGLEIIAINLDADREEADAFLDRTRPGFAIAWDPAGKIADAYGVMGMPSSYLIDRQGDLVYRHIGFRQRDQQAIEARIVQQLEQVPR